MSMPFINPKNALPEKKGECIYNKGYLSRFSSSAPDAAREDLWLYNAASAHCGLDVALEEKPELPSFCGPCKYISECVEDFKEYIKGRKPKRKFD